MQKGLLIAGGVLNAVFFLFHLLLGYQIYHLTQIAPAYRGLMEAFNVAGTLFILFFAYVSFFHQKELVRTGLGRIVLGLVALTYLVRAAEEFILFKFHPVVFLSCLIVGVIYVALLVISLKGHPAPLAASAAAGRVA